MLIMQDTTPRYAPSRAVSGLGALGFTLSPALGAFAMARNPGCVGCAGFGADPEPPPDTNAGLAALAGGVGTVVVLGVLALAGVLSYQAGKAMTPPGSSKKTWGWIGVPVGMFTGAPGLGVMGWVSNSKKG